MSEKGPSHGETGAGWDVVARAKYRAEFDEHVTLLKAGEHNLLRPEAEVILPLLPGAHVVHLQCSHGLDALGLLNAGAASVLGIDISSEMIAQAEAKAEATSRRAASFLCCDVAGLPASLDGTADLVYTGRGSLPWILDIAAWAATVRRLLDASGHLVLFEGHALANLWTRDAPGLQLQEGADYFSSAPIQHSGFPRSVVTRTVGDQGPRMFERHWRPGEVIEALVGAGLRVELFREYSTLFWDQFPHWPESLRSRLPNSYLIRACR